MTEKRQTKFWFSDEVVKRIDKAAAYCGQTRTAFVQAAVLAEVAEVEERRRAKKQRGSSMIEAGVLSGNNDNSSDNPTSYLAETLRQRQRERQQENGPAPTPVAQGQVVVNVGNQGNGTGSGNAAPTDMVASLATYVTAGSDFERGMRLRTAVAILKDTAKTDEEREVLAARLDEAISNKTKTEESGVIRAARVSFDKLMGIFGKDDQ